jgi:hypothetical protein
MILQISFLPFTGHLSPKDLALISPAIINQETASQINQFSTDYNVTLQTKFMQTPVLCFQWTTAALYITSVFPSVLNISILKTCSFSVFVKNLNYIWDKIERLKLNHEFYMAYSLIMKSWNKW